MRNTRLAGPYYKIQQLFLKSKEKSSQCRPGAWDATRFYLNTRLWTMDAGDDYWGLGSPVGSPVARRTLK